MKNKRDNRVTDHGDEDDTLEDFDLSRPEVIREGMGVQPRYTGKLKTMRTSISLPEYIIDDLRRLARIRGMTSYQAVLKEILAEKVYEEKQRLRARAKITSHFPISASGRLRPPLNREVLEIVHYFCGSSQSRQPNPTQI
ncbi:MAG: hypothetical protein ACLFUL_16880 [Desulfobacteraceae bacterium]